jgi:hypothetical protein
MKEGKEPLRTFSDLLQFYQVEQPPAPPKKQALEQRAASAKDSPQISANSMENVDINLRVDDAAPAVANQETANLQHDQCAPDKLESKRGEQISGVASDASASDPTVNSV